MLTRLACCMLLLGLGASAAGATPSATHRLTLLDTGKTVHVARGETLTVTLAEQPGTGYTYRWSMDPPLVLSFGGRVTGPAAAPGAMQRTTFTYTARKPGTTTLRLTNYGPSGREATRWPPFRVVVVVDPANPA